VPTSRGRQQRTGTTTTPTRTVKKAPKKKPKPATTYPIKTYDRKADATCAKYNPKMDQANTSHSLPSFETYLQRNGLRLRSSSTRATRAMPPR
jgi:hypothetical protein